MTDRLEGDLLLVLRPEDGPRAPPDYAVAVRRLIKRLLRSYGLRLVWIQQVEDDANVGKPEEGMQQP